MASLSGLQARDGDSLLRLCAHWSDGGARFGIGPRVRIDDLEIGTTDPHSARIHRDREIEVALR